MKEIKRINHVGLRVSNLKTSRAFYAKLGFEFIAGPIGPEPVAIMEDNDAETPEEPTGPTPADPPFDRYSLVDLLPKQL